MRMSMGVRGALILLAVFLGLSTPKRPVTTNLRSKATML